MSHTSDSHLDALVFDCDGVILDSANLKCHVFSEFYQTEPEPHRSAILAYLARGGGQSRDVKFKHIESHILGREVSTSRIRRLCAIFAERAQDQVLRAPPIPGAIEFLKRWKGHRPLYLLSATPEEELLRIAHHRGLDGLFDEVIGAPPDKTNGLLQLLTRNNHTASRTVMVGDSYNDYRAALSNCTHFIGVLPEQSAHSPFPTNTPCVPDLRSLTEALYGLTHA